MVSGWLLTKHATNWFFSAEGSLAAQMKLGSGEALTGRNAFRCKRPVVVDFTGWLTITPVGKFSCLVAKDPLTSTSIPMTSGVGTELIGSRNSQTLSPVGGKTQ